jgi:predicted dehydrogenase
MSDKNSIGIGVIGLGMGGAHARRLAAGEINGAHLAAVCDLDAGRCAQFADTAQFQDVGDMLKQDGVQAVIVATPHFAHVPLSQQALEAGRHVLVEKPLAVHKADCEAAIAVADEHPDLIFAEMFNQRTDPLYKKLKSLIDNGELGEIRRVNWIITNWFRSDAYYASGGWRATWHGEGGGVLVNQCPHNLDLLQWLCGMPSKVRAYCHFGKYHDIEVEDEVTAYLEYPNGATGVFITSTGEAPGTNRLEIAAENGKVVVENGSLSWTRNEVPMSQHCRESEQRFGGPATWDITIPVGNSDAQHKMVLQHFVDAIHGTGEIIADAREGIRSVELANAMLLSSLLDQTVSLPMDSVVFGQELAKLIEQSPKTPHKQNA